MKLLLTLLVSLLALPAAAQEPALSEKVDVNVVLVDVTVTDRAGNHILGLTKDDFIVKEDGVAQEIASLDYFTNRRLLTSPENQAAFKVERVKEERYFVIYFQKLVDPSIARDYFGELLRVKSAAAKFIEKDMLPGDRVAVVGYDVRLKVYSDFTSDRKQLKKALDDAVSFSNGVTKPSSDDPKAILNNIDYKTLMGGDGRGYDGLRILANALNAIPARKVLIYFSMGLGEVDSRNPYLAVNEESFVRPMIEALNRANVTVYAVNMLPNATGMRRIPPALEQTVSRMTSETGGEYFREAVSYSTPFSRIENANNGYYMLSYYRKRSDDAHGYQKIDVSLKNPEFRVTARDGYPY
jgi:Ca-activated chloride channel family protein